MTKDATEGGARVRGPERPASGSAAPTLLPALSLPRGGGAIRGIGETFTPDPAAGTGSLTVPLAISPGRGGFTPELVLRYDSGAGNGPWGLGWRLSVPSITRRTERGLPRYLDDRDTFMIAGDDELVPARIAAAGDAALDAFERGEYRVQRYRVRVESRFARIERWTHRATGETHWRRIDRDDRLEIYGRSAEARIADPAQPGRVFAWLLEEVRDDRGNVACYRYQGEDGAGVERGRPSEASRFAPDGGFGAVAQRYLKRVHYGNRVALARDQPAPASADAWLFEVVFDYGDHADEAPSPAASRDWAVRADPFSSYRATFEVRTYRRCARVLMFHRFPELGPEPCLVRSTDFAYEAGRVRSADGSFDGGAVATYLASVTHAGYLRAGGGGYERATMPPLALGYQSPVVHDRVRHVEGDSLGGIPGGVTLGTQWVDLDGEGVPGVLVPTAHAWFYKANHGDGSLGPAQLQRSMPSPSELTDGTARLVDLEGDGALDLVRLAAPRAGYFERTTARDWASFAALPDQPTLDWRRPDLRILDLDGDGLPDLLVTEHDALIWYRSRGADGFAPAARVPASFDDDGGPALVLADGAEAIHLADLSGDGLVDLVRVRNGEVCYWPNLGHGRFGAKVTLDGSPRFAAAEDFDPSRLRFADIDGSGTSDLIYLGADSVRLYFNLSGNALSPPLGIHSLPAADATTHIDVVDLLGHGTACLVASSTAPARASRPLAYVELLADGKPHLLTSIANNLGAETHITYAPSTRFYLDDQVAGRPWLTRLPFPVHVLERVEHVDHIARSRQVTRYRYHHGFHDGVERELGGFACVEQWDAESFAGHGGALDRPPVRTVTWFHTGAWLERATLERELAREYYGGDPDAPRLADTTVPADLTLVEERQAARSLRGRILRQEIYAEDGTPDALHPYRVSERDHEVRVVQRGDGERRAVFTVHQRQTIDLDHERRADDPRVAHALVLAVDDFGDVIQSAAVAYPRRRPAEPEQARLWATVTDATFAHRLDDLDDYRVGVTVEVVTRELTGLAAPARGVLTVEHVRAFAAAAVEVAPEAEPDPDAPRRRVIAARRWLYYRDDLGGALPLGAIGARALPYQTQALALTDGLVAAAFGDRVDDAILRDEAGYLRDGDRWWAPSDRLVPDPTRFYLPVEGFDRLGNRYRLRHDDHAILPVETEDPLGNRVRSENDYRVLGPTAVTDANGNRSEVAHDALGLVVRTALMGKAGEGDTLADPTTELHHDVHRWRTERKPVSVRMRAREQHGRADTRWHETYLYSDGSGREAMRKVPAEPVAGSADPRWIGTGRTVFDNKGAPVKRYEPFFSATPEYEDEAAIVEWGVTPIYHRDPIGRVVRVDLPDGTHTEVRFDTWRHATWDQNDTAAGTPWLVRRQAGSPGEQRAAALTAAHIATPTLAHVDALGRIFLTVADNGSAGMLATRIELDVHGRSRRLVDPRGAIAATYRHDLVGNVVVAAVADAGATHTLMDVAGKTIRRWDARGLVHRHVHDALQRPTEVWVTAPGEAERLVERTVYGESHPDAVARNLRGRPCALFDGAGAASTPRCDFKGNPLATERRLRADATATADWSSLAGLADLAAIEAAAAPALAAERFTTVVEYDALDRVIVRTTPDRSRTVPSYGRDGRVVRVDVHIGGAAVATPFVIAVEHNPRGQRTRIEHGNGVVETFTYDDQTFRLDRARAVRGGGAVLQDLVYIHDAIGNIVEAVDAVRFGNPAIAGGGRYVYDALYRLIEAEGREHPGQQPTDADPARLRLDHPDDMQALGRYRERYRYDDGGNLREVAHVGLDGGAAWTRAYDHAGDRNHLLATSAPGDAPGVLSHRYRHDQAGNVTAMPHLAELRWDHADRLQRADRGGGGIVHFAYDAGGQRVRKIYEHGAVVEERIYLDGYELYRRRNRATGALELERQTLHVGDGARRIAMVETKTIDTDRPGHVPVSRSRYQLDDHRGSTVVELDDDGAVIGYEAYYPYGGCAFRAAGATVEVSARRYRYGGHERDEETGLDYVQARYYAPWLGRWISPDPAGFVAGTNLYAYVQGNPIAFTDPTGTQPAPAVAGEEAGRRIVQTALQKAFEQWGVAGMVPAEGAATATAAAEGTAAVAGSTAAGEGTAAAAAAAPAAEGAAILAPVASAVGTVAALYLSTRLHMQRTGSIARYGSPYGVPTCTIPTPQCKGWNQSPLPAPQPEDDAAPTPQPTPIPAPEPDDKRRRRQREEVNLDTGTIIGATSMRNPFLAMAIHAYLADKRPVVTQTALTEILTGNIHFAGPTERAMLGIFLMGVKIIPDDPSERVMKLTTTRKLGANDKIIFGTGDKLGIKTITGDRDFRNAAAAQGVVLDVVVHPYARYLGI